VFVEVFVVAETRDMWAIWWCL